MVVEEDFAFEVFEEEVAVVADDVFEEFDLFEGLIVHEDVFVAFLIGEVEGFGFDVGAVNFVHGAEGSVHGVAGEHVFEAAFVHGLAFAGFDELEFGYFVGDAIYFNFQALA